MLNYGLAIAVITAFLWVSPIAPQAAQAEVIQLDSAEALMDLIPDSQLRRRFNRGGGRAARRAARAANVPGLPIPILVGMAVAAYGARKKLAKQPEMVQIEAETGV